MSKAKLIITTILGALVISGLIFLSLRFGAIPEQAPLPTSQFNLQPLTSTSQPSGGFSQLLAQESQLTAQPAQVQQEITQLTGQPQPPPLPLTQLLAPQVKALNIPLPDQTQLKQQLQQALRVKIVTVVTCQNQFIDSNPDNLSQPQIDQVCLDQANQTYQNTLTQP